MRAVDVIRKKRDGGALEPNEIAWLVDAYTRGEVADYQMSAFAMAVVWRGMSMDETVALTRAMLASGRVLDFAHVPGVKVDKHSTGGVGDKISLPLVGAVAACGVKVPMMSGRGLGHTGGTLDKLESIPGFRVDLSLEEFERVLTDVGCAMIGQTADICPADKKLYALRDVTATVESIPLIAASIMSKKMAEGIDALVLDVKVGRGAFMKTRDDAEKLARTMVAIGRGFGKKVVAYLTDMSEPIGSAVGNALEAKESIQAFAGAKFTRSDLRELVVVLGGEMLRLAGAGGPDDIARVLDNGEARKKFRQLVVAQGGDGTAVDGAPVFAKAARMVRVNAEADGKVKAVDAEAIGRAAMLLGAGRRMTTDKIDPTVGITGVPLVGTVVRPGRAIALLHVNDESNLAEAEGMVKGAIEIAADPSIAFATTRILGRIEG
ncbi:MAG: thymidine phosphorylase [Deltaproteobacteria bacterium]|nr:thymidine phosphorylase [Deltaproteobacteria bacterium]